MQKNNSTNKAKSTNANKAKTSGGSRTTNRKANKNTDRSANSKFSSGKRKQNTAESKKVSLYNSGYHMDGIYILYVRKDRTGILRTEWEDQFVYNKSLGKGTAGFTAGDAESTRYSGACYKKDCTYDRICDPVLTFISGNGEDIHEPEQIL